MTHDGPCQVTGGPGIRDDEAGCVCACLSPLMGIRCDGSPKTLPARPEPPESREGPS